MRLFYIFILIILFIKCSDAERIDPDAVGYNNQAVEIMMKSVVEPDSFKLAISLMDKAIKLAPT